MSRIELLDLPPIPPELLASNEDIIKHSEFADLRKNVSDELFAYLQAMFKEPITVCYGVVQHGLPPHKDVEGREVGYNFILNTGGRHAVTAVYDDDLNVLQEMVCQAGHWYKLPGGTWHSIHGVEPGQHRILISVTYLHDMVNPKGRKPHPKINQNWIFENNRALFKELGLQ